MESKCTRYSRVRAGMAALKAGFMLCVLLGLQWEAMAQRDIFHWELSGYGALLTSELDLDIPDAGSRYASGLRIHRNLGSAWQLGWHGAHQNFSSEEEVTYTGLSLTYNWDNGALLKKRAFISPYHTIDGGYMARADFNDLTTTDEVAALGLENGLKLRLGDRLTGSVAYGVFWQLRNDDLESNFDRAHFNMWKVGLSYHFGARKVNYRGPMFDAAAYFSDARPKPLDIQPILQLDMVPLDADSLPPMAQVRLPQDSMVAKTAHPLPKTVRDTVYVSRVDTIFLVKRDSVYYADTTGAIRYTLPPRDTSYAELMDRMARLEALLAERSAADTTQLGSRYAYAEPKSETKKSESKKREEEPSKARQAEDQPAPAAKAAAEVVAAPKTEYVTDPAVVQLLERQESLIASQNEILREMQRSQSEMRVQTDGGRMPRVRTQVAPTVMVPLNDGRRRDDDRIAELEQELTLLKAQMAAASQPTGIAGADTSFATSGVSYTARPFDFAAAADTAALADTTAMATPVTALDRDSLNARVDALNQRADSIAASLSQPSQPTEDAPTAAEVRKDVAPRALRAEYPAVFLFGLNRDDVDATYDDAFDRVAADLKAHPNKVARITGYTDRSGNVEYNRQLSKRRAASIKRHLTERGVEASQVVMSGEGATEGGDKWSPGDRRVEVELIDP